MASLLPLHQVFICKTHALPRLRQFWNLFQTELTNERPYLASIGSMRLRLQELQKTNSKAQKLRQQEQKGYEKVNGVLHHQGLSFVPKAIRIERISHYHNNFLIRHFGIKKTCKLLILKYYWPTLHHNVEVYMKSCDICLVFKVICHKP